MLKYKSMIKYVFFDLDETLIDIKKAQNIAIECLFGLYGFNNVTDLNSFIKKWDELTDYHYKFYTTKQISYEEQRKRRIIDLFKAYNIPLTIAAIDVYNIYLKEFENAWTAFDDVKETLKKLKDNNYILGLISNGDYNQQVQKMQKVGIYDMFDYINTSSQFEYSKPNPKLFETIFAMHNINTEEICYIGDSYKKDVLPCRQIGVKAILIDRKGVDYNDLELIKTNTLNNILKLIEN